MPRLIWLRRRANARKRQLSNPVSNSHYQPSWFIKPSYLLLYQAWLQQRVRYFRVYSLGHKFVLGPCQRSKMSLSQAQNIFMPANINSIVVIVSVSITLKHCYMHWSIVNLPEHKRPSPANPSLQVQLCPPTVLVQFAFTLQLWLPLLHSSISTKPE